MTQPLNNSTTHLLLWAVVAIVTPTGVTAQDSHYWTYQFGPRANLLGGAVVGSVVDISSVYYNPGALALIPDPELLATSKVFELSDITLNGTSADLIELNDLRIDEAPGFFAGTMPFKFLGSNTLGYSVFTRARYRVKLDGVEVSTTDLIAGTPGEEDLFARLILSSDMSDTWVGLTWSAPRGRAGIGISQFVAYRSQKNTRLVDAQSYNPTLPAGATSTAEGTYRYWNARLLWKLGITFDWYGVSWGLTGTTPSLSLFGSGSQVVRIASFGQDLDGDGVGDPVFVAAAEDDLDAMYRSSWSLALGATYGSERTRLHLSTEYFGKVGKYAIMDGGEFQGQSTGDTLSLELTQELDDAINFAVGLEHRLSSRFTGYASFRTDFSTNEPNAESVTSLANINLFFITVGAAMNVLSADVTLGLSYGWGRDNLPIALGQAIAGDEIIGQVPTEFDMKYNSLRLILAFSI